MNGRWTKRSGIMLCYPLEEKRLARWNPPYLVQPKPDGERSRSVSVSGASLLLSSEENIFVSVPHINEALDKLLASPETDGELYVHGWTFEEIHSVVSRTKNLHPDYAQMEYHIFDIVMGGPQHVRSRAIPELNLRPPLFQVPTIPCWTLEEIMKVYDQFLEQGYEGIVVRHIDNEYVRRRTPLMMKFKPKKDDFYDIIDYKEEIDKNGNPKGRLGALVCRGSDETTFSVGSGLTDGDRQTLWDTREALAGKLCHVQYQHLTARKGVPRFPVFVSVVDKPIENKEN